MNQRGFTLIELLMVVAIIGMLSTIILGSLRTASLRASDSALQREAIEFRNLMELERSDSGTYTRLKAAGWKPNQSACSAGYSGPYAARATAICNAVVQKGGAPCQAGGGCLYTGTLSPANPVDKYTVMVYLPGESTRAGVTTWFCVGSSGNQSKGSVNTGEGCLQNP